MHFARQKSMDKAEGEDVSKVVDGLEAAEDQKQIMLWRTGEQGQLLTNQENSPHDKRLSKRQTLMSKARTSSQPIVEWSRMMYEWCGTLWVEQMHTNTDGLPPRCF